MQLDIQFPQDGVITTNDTNTSVILDYSSDELTSELGFLMGDNCPLLVDGVFSSLDNISHITQSEEPNHVLMNITFPYFKDSILYDPYITMH